MRRAHAVCYIELLYSQNLQGQASRFALSKALLLLAVTKLHLSRPRTLTPRFASWYRAALPIPPTPMTMASYLQAFAVSAFDLRDPLHARRSMTYCAFPWSIVELQAHLHSQHSVASRGACTHLRSCKASCSPCNADRAPRKSRTAS